MRIDSLTVDSLTNLPLLYLYHPATTAVTIPFLPRPVILSGDLVVIGELVVNYRPLLRFRQANHFLFSITNVEYVWTRLK